MTSGVAAAAVKAATQQVFPPFVFTDNLSKNERSYLGISSKKTFYLKNLRGAVVVADMFNTYCTTCPRNVPVLNELYTLVENDPKLRGRIKVIAIAVGNTPEEISVYKKAHGAAFPILSDPHFSLHRLLGEPRVPYTIIVRNNVIVFTHRGVIDSSADLLELAVKYLRRH